MPDLNPEPERTRTRRKVQTRPPEPDETGRTRKRRRVEIRRPAPEGSAPPPPRPTAPAPEELTERPRPRSPGSINIFSYDIGAAVKERFRGVALRIDNFQIEISVDITSEYIDQYDEYPKLDQKLRDTIRKQVARFEEALIDTFVTIDLKLQNLKDDSVLRSREEDKLSRVVASVHKAQQKLCESYVSQTWDNYRTTKAEFETFRNNSYVGIAFGAAVVGVSAVFVGAASSVGAGVVGLIAVVKGYVKLLDQIKSFTEDANVTCERLKKSVAKLHEKVESDARRASAEYTRISEEFVRLDRELEVSNEYFDRLKEREAELKKERESSGPSTTERSSEMTTMLKNFSKRLPSLTRSRSGSVNDQIVSVKAHIKALVKKREALDRSTKWSRLVPNGLTLSQMSAASVKAVFGINFAGIPSISECDKTITLLKNKVKGIEVGGVELSKRLNVMLNRVDNFKRQIGKRDFRGLILAKENGSTRLQNILNAIGTLEGRIDVSIKRIIKMELKQQFLEKSLVQIERDMDYINRSQTLFSVISSQVISGLGSAAIGIATGEIYFGAAQSALQYTQAVSYAVVDLRTALIDSEVFEDGFLPAFKEHDYASKVRPPSGVTLKPSSRGS